MPETITVCDCQLAVIDGTLVVTVGKNFDTAAQHLEWAAEVIARRPGPFTGVRLELGQAMRLSSVFFAGLMQLHDHYVLKGKAGPVILAGVDRRTRTNLQILRLDSHFAFES
jgi:hypothetical protein